MSNILAKRLQVAAAARPAATPAPVSEDKKTTEGAAKLVYGSRAALSRAEAKVEDVALTEEQQMVLGRSMAQAFQEAFQTRVREVVAAPKSVMDERQTIQTTAVFTFSWRKAPEKKDGVAVTLDSVACADGTPTEPHAAALSKEALAKMAQGRLDLSKEQFLHSAYITAVKSTAPFPLAFTLENVQNKERLECETSNDGTASTYVIGPEEAWVNQSKEIYRLRNVDPKDIVDHGSTDLEEEMRQLVSIQNHDHVLVPPHIKIGKILKHNEASIMPEGQKLEVMQPGVIDMYAVPEATVMQVLADYNDKKLSKLEKTRFAEVRASLARADRSPKDTREFADATDAPFMNKVSLAHAHSTKHSVMVKVQFNILDPALLTRKNE